MIGRASRGLDLVDVYADRLGIESRDAVRGELASQFEHLSRLVLGGEMPPAGTASAEGATAYGELCVLVGFLADAHDLLTRKETLR
ncbi:hypothetical protein ACQPYH_39810 [Kribbella sp. CA-245084]|uniref:hypothetical protein n=1 Tax=Kribbella sp. CA-245084 TaxID=3239940 RepID=UPI003D910EB8